MSRHNLIKVIKRAEREQAAQVAIAGGAQSDSSAHAEAGEMMAATVQNWISEFRQTRQTQKVRFQEIRQQLGWLQDGG